MPKSDRGRFSAKRKREAVLRLLRGEDLDVVSREIGVTGATLARWREAVLEGALGALRTKPVDEHSERIKVLEQKLGIAGTKTSKGRVLRLMRENNLLAPHFPRRQRGNKAHDRTITTDKPDEMWGTDATAAVTREEGTAFVFLAVDHCTGECMGIHASASGSRVEALEPIRQAVRHSYGTYGPDVAQGLSLRHDHGSQYTSHDFQSELRFLGIKSSPSYVAEPECNGVAERFVRTLKEQVLWVETFETIEELRQALIAFKHRYNHEWLVQKHGHITPAQARAYLSQPAAQAA